MNFYGGKTNGVPSRANLLLEWVTWNHDLLHAHSYRIHPIFPLSVSLWAIGNTGRPGVAGGGELTVARYRCVYGEPARKALICASSNSELGTRPAIAFGARSAMGHAPTGHVFRI